MRPSIKLIIITVHLNNSKGFESTFNSLFPVLKNSNFIQWIIKDEKSNAFELGNI